MNFQRLRNLTTGLLHTEIGFVYEDLEWITGEQGLMTHMLPRAIEAVLPWLKENVADPRFWDGTYEELGFCVSPEDDMRELVKEYAALWQERLK